MLLDVKSTKESCFSTSGSPAIEFSKILLTFIETLTSNSIIILFLKNVFVFLSSHSMLTLHQ